MLLRYQIIDLFRKSMNISFRRELSISFARSAGTRSEELIFFHKMHRDKPLFVIVITATTAFT